LGQDVHPLVCPLITGIHVVALGQGDARGTDKYRVQTVNRTGCVAQHAIDTHAELLVAVKLLRSLKIFALGNWLLLVADEPWLATLQLGHEVGDFDYQVTDYREVVQWLDTDGLPLSSVVRKKGGTGQLGLAVHHHAATSADPHPA